MKKLLSGNEAIARGALEAGVTVATGYPGTPSTEILEAVVRYKDRIYCEWSPNEKVAFEVAAGAAWAGARAIVTMKHVGLNVAADPLMTLAYTGVKGGFVAVVADDPGMHSSQNEQDTRRFAQFAKVPILEPSDSQEAKDFVALAIEISETYQTPVILRSTTRVSHSRGLVRELPRSEPTEPVGFQKDPPRYVPIPLWGRKMRLKLEQRLEKLAEAANRCRANRIEWRDRDLGVVTSGIAYQYVREVFPNASVLKLGWSFPFPDALIREFAGGVQTLLVVEELEDFLQEHIRAMGIPCQGKEIIPNIGELSPDVLIEAAAQLTGHVTGKAPGLPPTPIDDLPARPPVLCPGCPHRGIFHALRKFDVVVTGDIGCYSLGVFSPLERIDTILCMGGGISVAHGMDRAGEPRRVVGVVGDSTFFHSGMTGLLDVIYNRGASTLLVLDNRTTAMTGHQDHPGTGRTLMGQATAEASIEAIARACGMKNVATVDPYDLKATGKVLREAIESPEPWVIVSRAPCPLDRRTRLGGTRQLDAEACRRCGACVKLGCPALECREERISINPLLCIGCGLCSQVCPVDALRVREVTVDE